MADIIEINIATLNSDIGSMESELQKLRNEVKLTFDAVSALDAMWNGPANDAFNRAFAADHQVMEDMCRVIESLIEYMKNAKDEYRKCESAVADEINSIRI